MTLMDEFHRQSGYADKNQEKYQLLISGELNGISGKKVND
jgi:hypothetical protein